MLVVPLHRATSGHQLVVQGQGLRYQQPINSDTLLANSGYNEQLVESLSLQM